MSAGSSGQPSSRSCPGQRQARKHPLQTIVVDTSVAVKWFFPEPHAPRAESILFAVREGKLRLAAPDLIIYELANTIWKRCNLGEITGKEARDILLDFQKLPVHLVPGETLDFDSLGLALDSGCTAYDTAFVALARGLETVAVTADRKLVRAFQEHPLRRHVIHLHDWSKGM